MHQLWSQLQSYAIHFIEIDFIEIDFIVSEQPL